MYVFELPFAAHLIFFEFLNPVLQCRVGTKVVFVLFLKIQSPEEYFPSADEYVHVLQDGTSEHL